MSPHVAAVVRKADNISALSPDHLNATLSLAKRDNWLMTKGKNIAQSFLSNSTSSQQLLAHPKVVSVPK